MATKLFFRSTASDYGTGNNDAKLNGSALPWAARVISTTAGSGIVGHSVATVAGPTNGLEIELGGSVPLVWYSAPLNADATISGSITWNLWASEINMADNVAINGRLEVIDGATGTITLIDQTARVTEVAQTTATVNNFAETPAAGVACKRGDRLRVRVFGDDLGGTAMGAGGSVTFDYNAGTGVDGDSYFTLTENLTFVSEPAGTQIFPTDTASAVDVSTSVAGLLSSFTGSDEDPLSEGGNWAKLNSSGSAVTRVGNAAAAPGSSGTSYWTPTNFGPDVEVYATLSVVSTNFEGVYARLQGEGGAGTYDGYLCTYNGSASINLVRVTNGAQTTLASLAVTPANGAKVGIACHGDQIAGWYQPSGGAWSQFAIVTDTTYPSAGKVGLLIAGASSRMDDFYAGTASYTFPTGGSEVEREAWTSRGGGVQTDVTNTTAGYTAPIQVTDTAGGTVVDWFTKPLVAFTLGGAVRVNARALESSAAANASVRCEVARVEGDGTSPTVWGATTYAPELTTSEAAQSFLVGGDDLAVSNGQRLRIRFSVDDADGAGGTGGAMGASQTVTLYYAGAAAATGDTYLTFTQTLTEYVSVAAVPPYRSPYPPLLAQ